MHFFNFPYKILMRILLYFLSLFILLSLKNSPVSSPESELLEITVMPQEFWWTGLSSLGYQGPYDAHSVLSIDLWGKNYGNQAQPLLLSNKGRYIWSEDPLKFDFDAGQLTVSVREGQIVSGKAGDNLKSAFQFVVENFFPPNQKLPKEIMFTQPQYNTWIELTYDQNEADILSYAQSILDNGYPPGVLMIDDNWQEDYGVWKFSPRRFKDPKGMMAKLHRMGFEVMLWVCPFVSPDSPEYRKLARDGFLIRERTEGESLSSIPEENPAIIRWWNGASACLDMSNPSAKEWIKGQLDYLVDQYGVDGFKFDAGDADFYANEGLIYEDGNPNDQTANFASLGLDYPLNEYRASWKMAGLPLAQRLRDKEHKWEDLQKLIPDMMSQSMMGYAYTCPDMIGGGEFKSFQNLTEVDEELVVRSAQVHALMPMMQFSVAPWRVLSSENNEICRQAATLHRQMGSHILSLAQEASRTGEPIVKPMAYVFPDKGYESVKDQFVLGEDIIVAPVLKKGARKRRVKLPEGKWRGDDGMVYKGGGSVEVEAPLERLPYFTKIYKN